MPDRPNSPPPWLSALTVAAIAFTLARETIFARRRPLSFWPRRRRRQGAGAAVAADDTGASAQAPATWKQFLYRIVVRTIEHRLMAVAAGVAFYGLLALFPAITALVSFYGMFAKPSSISGHLSFLADVMPVGGFGIVQDQIDRIVVKASGKLELGFIVGLVLALWSANAGTKAIMDGLNVVEGRSEQRNFFRLNLVSLAFTLAGLVITLLALAAVVVLPLLFAAFGIHGVSHALLSLVQWPALLLIILSGLAVLYRFGPSPHPDRCHWFSPGAVVATVAWLSGSVLLSGYLSNIADYNVTYGSLGAVIGLLIWLWLSALVVLIGTELNTELSAANSRAQ
jgi:membrane protein